MPIICFFGPDGSGKTTLVRALAERLNPGGFRVRLSWMRGTHTFASVLAKLLHRFKVFEGSSNPYYNICIPRSLQNMWQLVEFASAIPIILLKFILPSMLGYWVVAERYLPDFITWVSVTTSDQLYPESIEAKFLLALSSKAHAKIYVITTHKELSKRRKETNPNFISKQLKLYEKIASAIQAHRLDTTNKTAKESLEEALKLLNLGQMPTIGSPNRVILR